MLVDVLDRAHGVLEIAWVVERVENTEYVHTVFSGLLDELVNHHVLVVAVTEEILAAQQHLQATIRHQLAECPQALPGIFIKEADAGVKGCAAPALHTPKTGLVHFFTDIDHVFHSHSRCHEALMSVSERYFRYTNGSWTHNSKSKGLWESSRVGDREYW